MGCNSEENNDSSSCVNSRKERLRWTDELHDRFEEAINQLGGADRATPKGILKTMNIPVLTIYHVKSHLQKYRIAKFVPESSSRGKYEKRSISEMLPNFSTTSAVQLNEALRLHMEAERQLSHQIEVSLKLKIEAQGRYMDSIYDDLQIEKNINTKTVKPSNCMTSLPSLCEESDTNSPVQKRSRQDQKSRDHKRVRVENGLVSMTQVLDNYAPKYLAKPYDCQSAVLADPGMARTQYATCMENINMPWNLITVLDPSPLMPGLPQTR